MRLGYLLAAGVLCSAAFGEQSFRKIDVYSGGGLLPQVVDSTDWKTSFYFHNMDTGPIYAAIVFLNDKGDPMSLPLGGTTTSGRSFTLPVGNTTVFETDGTGSLKQGYAVVLTCDKNCADPTSKFASSKLAFYAVFRLRVAGRPDAEAVVPVEAPERESHVIFDNRNGYATGIALLNFMGGNITVTIQDQNANVIATDILQVAEDGKLVFVLADKYPATAGKYGCIVFSGSGVAAMGLRFNPSGSFTSAHAVSMH